MADVNRTRERAQLILVTGVVLAVAIVGLALVLNSVIFTENLATRNQEQGSNEVLSDRLNARGEFSEGITEVNDEVVTSVEFDWLRSNLSQVIEIRDERLMQRAALSGGAVDYSLVSATSGTRIRQTNMTRNFTAGDERAGGDHWAVVEDAEAVRHFQLTANRGSLYESSIDTTKSALADSAFHVNVTDANGDNWKVYIFRGAATNNVYLLVEDPSDSDFTTSTDGYETFVSEACTYRNSTVNIWMTGAIVENTRCEQLTFFDDDAVRPLTIRYDNVHDDSQDTDRIRGTYDLLVDKNVSRSPSPYYLSSEGKSPFTQKAIVSAQVQMQYRSQDTEYYAHIRTEPARRAPSVYIHNPSVETWDIKNDSSTAVGGPEYEMDWTVSDEDGDLEEVELLLASNTTSTVHDRETIAVSGASASGTTTLNASALSLDQEYRLEIVVTDEENGADNDVVLDTADGSP